ncbi:RNA-binding protein [Phycicoccus sp. CSK15P-2]|uniref:RNA-binding protein n=1 Tax=Phycicoccus sp. CSK15P-2 TaxID=2807627 RepID=UPI00194E9F27|nr:RNA-binding protein [Phycicoccus sp. CSK15P-2]MBM6404313.1 RNA-binding protein [Phycicoccus sp. CSK15P-2]
MGLNHPTDLGAWRRWQDAQQPWSRRVRAALAARRGRTDDAVLTAGGPAPRVVVALDATTPTALGALLRPAVSLDAPDVAVISPGPLGDSAPAGWDGRRGAAAALLDEVVGPRTVVLALGHFLPVGALAHAAARRAGARFVTVQHGLLTPHAPPLPEGTHLLAWSAADAEYWRSGRTDVTATVVGSQLLWDAAEAGATPADPDAPPVFLGQLHGAELPRQVLAATAEQFCRDTGATYRPHPSEKDRRSRATHARWERAGITVERSGTPLRELGSPVVSVFSTGVLEAAAAGLPAWVHLVDPPGWVTEFWERYGLSRWGGRPTSSPERPARAPSMAVAAAVRGMMAG